jgi:hypothetical protein
LFHDETWTDVCLQAWELYQQFRPLFGIEQPATADVGVDISEATLVECQRQLELTSLRPMWPILIETQNPERLLEQVNTPIDLFLCLYVFELLPSKEYGQRILRIASQLLQRGGRGSSAAQAAISSGRTLRLFLPQENVGI